MTTLPCVIDFARSILGLPRSVQTVLAERITRATNTPISTSQAEGLYVICPERELTVANHTNIRTGIGQGFGVRLNYHYRKKLVSDIWHFCTNCSQWPTDSYISSEQLPGDQTLCNECIVKNQHGECNKGPDGPS
jgi:hypothetical protein